MVFIVFSGCATLDPRYVIMVPAWHNADSIGYNPKATGRPIESWGESRAIVQGLSRAPRQKQLSYRSQK
jgi:hypothetical protein